MKVKNSHNKCSFTSLDVPQPDSVVCSPGDQMRSVPAGVQGPRVVHKCEVRSTIHNGFLIKIPPIPISPSNIKSKVPYQTAPWWPSKVPSLSPLREYLVNESDYNNSPSQWQQGISEDRKTTRSYYGSKRGIIDDQNTYQTLGWWSLAEEKSRSPSLKGYHLLRYCWHCALSWYSSTHHV